MCVCARALLQLVLVTINAHRRVLARRKNARACGVFASLRQPSAETQQWALPLITALRVRIQSGCRKAAVGASLKSGKRSAQHDDRCAEAAGMRGLLAASFYGVHALLADLLLEALRISTRGQSHRARTGGFSAQESNDRGIPVVVLPLSDAAACWEPARDVLPVRVSRLLAHETS